MTLGFTYGVGNNNGNVRTQTITRDGVQQGVQSYIYDGMNRLQSAGQTGTNAWSQGYWYDVWGNRAIGSYGGVAPDPTQNAEVPKNLTQQSANTPFLGSNRIGAFAYDNAGNVTNFAGVRYNAAYDAENRQTSVTQSNSNNERTDYVYDGEGRRIKKTVGVGTASPVTTTFVYDAMGQLAAEYGGPEPTEMGTRYLFGDHLGSTRLVAKADGSEDKRYDYLPFGEEIANGTLQGYPANAEVRGQQSTKFTSHLRDAETGLDFMQARYYSSASGRFTSPDEWAGGIVDAYSGGAVGSPGPLPYADITDPQTINKYAYVRNNPLRYIDPTGHAEESVIDITMEEIDKFVRPLVESAETKVNTVLEVGGRMFGVAVAFLSVPMAGPTSEIQFTRWNEEQIKQRQQQSQPKQTLTPGAPALPNVQNTSEHKKGARPSTQEKHEAGKSRKKKDRGGERGDDRRRPPRKRPDGWKGPWPPKEGQDWN